MNRMPPPKKTLLVLYAALLVAHIHIAHKAWRLSGLHRLIAPHSDSDVYLRYSQPLIWLFAALTLAVCVNTLLDKTGPAAQALLVFVALATGTAFLHLFVLLAGYLPVLEAGAG